MLLWQRATEFENKITRPVQFPRRPEQSCALAAEEGKVKGKRFLSCSIYLFATSLFHCTCTWISLERMGPSSTFSSSLYLDWSIHIDHPEENRDLPDLVSPLLQTPFLSETVRTTELQNAKSFTRSQTFKLNFTPRKARKSRQCWHTTITKC